MKFILILYLLLFSATATAQSWKELNNQFIELYNNDEFEKAAPISEKAIVAAKKEFGINHINYATSLSNLATVYTETGEYKKAESLFIQAKNIRLKLLGSKHPDYAETLNDLAFVYTKTKQYQKAESLYLQAKQIRLQALGENNEDYATTLNDLATLYTDTKQYDKAEPLYLQAKQISEKIVGTSDPEYITTIDNLYLLYEKMGNNEKAEPLYLLSYAFYKEHPGTDSAELENILDRLASLYDRIGQYSKAETYYLNLIDLSKQLYGEMSPEYARVINKLALIYSVMGQYEKAEPLYFQAAEIRKEVLGEMHPDYATSLNNLASHFLDLGQYEKTESFYLQAIDIAQQNPDKSNTDYLTFLNNLAFLYMQRGKYDFAEPLFFNLKEAYKKTFGENDPSYATPLDNLATIYFKTGQYQKAEALFIQAKEIRRKVLGKEHPGYAGSLNNLAVLYETTGQYKKAEPLHIEAQKIYLKVYGEAHPDYANSINNLALLYHDMEQNEKAVQLFIRSAAIRKKVLGETHPDYAASLNNLAYCYLDLEQYDTAEKYFIQTKEIMKKALGEDHPSYSVAVNNLSDLYVKTGQFKKAEPGLLQASKIILQNILNTFTVLSESEKNNYLKSTIYVFEKNNSFLYQYKKASPEMVVNNFNLQLVLKSASLSDTKNMMESLLTSPDSSIRKLFSTWTANRNLLAKQYSLLAARRRGDLKNLEEQTEAGEKELNRLSSEFRTQQAVLQVSMQDVQKKLEPDEVAIEFVRFQLVTKQWTDSVMYAAYILHKNDSVPDFIPLCEERQLQRLFDSAGKTSTTSVSKFYRGIEIKNKGTAFLGDSLYKLIWKPMEPYLKNVKKIAYSPAGKLYSIAFHALPVDSAALLMDKYQLQQYTSTRQLLFQTLSDQTLPPNSIALFGDANFTMDSLQLVKQRDNELTKENISTSIYIPQNRGNRSGVWNSLPGTADEVKKIKILFEQNKINAKIFMQTTASEKNLKLLSNNSPQVLHIATHGFFLPEPGKKKKDQALNQNAYTLADDPLLRSGLILSGGNYAWSGKTPIDGVEDGIATAYEISQLNLSNTELVVLSACETALGDVKGSEGVFGLQRAFKMAGVKKMIVSLWQVPDKETAELMTTFYTYWMKGKTINDAFSQAQADMRKKYSPFYWAAFVLVE